MNDELKQQRLDVLAKHFQSEVDHDWDTCIGTFNGHPRYEIMPTGQVFDGEEEVRNYHRRQREWDGGQLPLASARSAARIRARTSLGQVSRRALVSSISRKLCSKLA